MHITMTKGDAVDIKDLCGSMILYGLKTSVPKTASSANLVKKQAPTVKITKNIIITHRIGTNIQTLVV